VADRSPASDSAGSSAGSSGRSLAEASAGSSAGVLPGADPWPDGVHAAAVAAVQALRAAGVTVATAESLTGGLIGAALTSEPGSSAVYRGGVVSYATDLKHRLLGVDAGLLDRVGAVHPDVARGMAEGVRDRLGADYGVGVTGVAGPDPQDGAAPGTVWLALAGPGGTTVVDVSGTGSRSDVRLATTARALSRLREVVAGAAEGNRETDPGQPLESPGPVPR
jgi:nicotinamide-nucleotide amidase